MLDELLNLFRSFDEQGYDKNGFNRQGFNKEGLHRNGTRFNRAGYDIDGYNADGFDSHGYDRNGFNKDGFDKDGFDCEGYNRAGFNRDGYDRAGYDSQGYGKDGYNRAGYDREGLDRDLFTEDGRYKGQTIWYLDASLSPSVIPPRLACQALSIASPLEHDRILKNAYGIIGSVKPLSAREAKRKAGEMEKLLAIGIEPELTLDLSPIQQMRNPELAKRASEQLASQKREPIERFFWFMRFNDDDHVSDFAYFQMSNGYIRAAYHTWLAGASQAKEEQREALYYKNAALAATLLVMNEHTTEARDAFVIAWTETSRLWHLLPDETESIATPDAPDKEASVHTGPIWIATDEQKRSIVSNMIELLYETGIRFNDPRIAQLSTSLFGSLSHRFSDTWVAPVLAEIESVCNDLRTCQNALAEADSQQKRSSLESEVMRYEKHVKSIIDDSREKGILQSDDSAVNKALDAFAQAIRNVAIAFNPASQQPSNSDLAYVKKHLNIAYRVATSDYIKQRIEQDKRDLQQLKETLAYVKKRDKQIEEAVAHANANRFDEAIGILTRLKQDARTATESQELGRLINQVQKSKYIQAFAAAMASRNFVDAWTMLDKAIQLETDLMERYKMLQARNKIPYRPFGF